jgi:hypothetical protein
MVNLAGRAEEIPHRGTVGRVQLIWRNVMANPRRRGIQSLLRAPGDDYAGTAGREGRRRRLADTRARTDDHYVLLSKRHFAILQEDPTVKT